MDLRKVNTRKKILASYIKLLNHRDPLSIAVVDVCKNAKINRSTFYEYYPYIDKLIEDVIREELMNISPVNNDLIDAFYFRHYTSIESVKIYVLNLSSNKVILKLIRSDPSDYFKLLIANTQTRYEINKYCITNPSEKAGVIARNYGVFSIIFSWLNKTIDLTLDEVSICIYDLLKKMI